MNIAILGCGNMGQAIIRGLQQGTLSDVHIIGYDKREEVLSVVRGSITVQSPDTWFSGNEVLDAVILAVKPQDVAEALSPFKTAETKALWISIAAGVSLEVLQGFLPGSSHICRVMPNTPALIGEGISAFALNSACSAQDSALVESLFNACGKVVSVPEKLMNAVTGLSGSGPAYVYLFIESLIEGGVTAGLPYEVAAACAVQTVIGAARMVQQSAETPAVLKSRVMSPGGTTVRGLLALERGGFKYSVINAVKAATERASVLNKKKETRGAHEKQ